MEGGERVEEPKGKVLRSSSGREKLESEAWLGCSLSVKIRRHQEKGKRKGRKLCRRKGNGVSQKRKRELLRYMEGKG